jgi:hypothetical protein
MTPTPFIDLVPKDPVKNLQWRIRCRERALVDVEFREALIDACELDVLFWFNFALWCHEPRETVKVKPFITWVHQDPAILQMDAAIDEAEGDPENPIEAVVDKSRAQGGTLCYLGVDLRRWRFEADFKCGLLTRNEALVDSASDSDALLYKVAWMIDRLPVWMLPNGFDWKKHRSLTDHTIVNPENGAAFLGYAAGQDVGRGGRKTKVNCDEIGAKDFIQGNKDQSVMDSLAHVTNCIFLVSTFGADSGVFYDAVMDKGSGIHIVMDWHDNPSQTRLAYITREGITAAIRPKEQAEVNEYIEKNHDKLKKLEKRGFKMEGWVRSPWYDARCSKPWSTPRSIARELDRNPKGAVGKVFDTETLDALKQSSCRAPVWQGKLVLDPETFEVRGFLRQEGGPLELWFDPDRSGMTGQFAVGCDISAGGTGDTSSNSVACGLNRLTGEQVMQYTVRGMLQTKFARHVVALCRWLDGAFLGWEDSGIAKPFAKEVARLQYTNILMRDTEEIGSGKKLRKAGWWNGSDQDKADLFEGLEIAWQVGDSVPRSVDMIVECGEYEWEGGKIIHRPTKKAKGDGRAHGDRCIAFGVAWFCCQDRPLAATDADEEPTQKAPYGSIAWCIEQEALEVKTWNDDHPQMTLHDLLATVD